MAGSVLRLTIVVVFSTLPNYAVLQQPESWIQNPFRLKTNFLRDFMKVRDELFPFSFAYRNEYLTRTTDNPLVERLLSHQPYDSVPNNLVKRKAIIENPKVQNFIREKINDSPRNNTSNKRKDYLNKLINFHFGTNSTNYIAGNFSIPTLSSDKYQEISTQNSGPYILENNVNKKLSVHSSPNEVSQPTSEETTPLKQFSYDDNIGHFPNDVSPYYHTQLNEIKDTSKKNIIPGRIKAPFNKDDNEERQKISFLGYVISTLTQLPFIGNVLRASVDPLYRPIVRTLQPQEAERENVMSGEQDMNNWCFGILGCVEPTIEFFHPLYRPVNLPPYPREQINTQFSFHSREDTKGTVVSAMEIEKTNLTTFSPNRPTKFVIHGYLNGRVETWVWELVRGLLKHGDYNVVTVDWSGGSFALYSQATANIRVVALEIARLCKWLKVTYKMDPLSVHLIGHSLGAHTAGYVGDGFPGLGRITGLDPAEPFFQYMPPIVRLDTSDAKFVDVIHTDIDSFFAITGPRGFGLEQAIGHIDFYPNGGKEQPGCNQLLATVPMTLISEGEDIVEGINSAQSELVNCDHIRASKLFTDSLVSDCPYLSFECSSYKSYKEGNCFGCGAKGEKCASMGINADQWHPGNKSLVKMFLDTHLSPNFCKFHYLLTINFNDPTTSVGTLRGRLKVSLITEDGNLRKFDLTALSPLKFPRHGTRTFMLEHHEDLSGAQEALLNWTFESDLLNPMTFCVLFCKADLSVTTVSLMSIDTHEASIKVAKLRAQDEEIHEDSIFNGGEIIMCHKKAESVITIPSESTVKIAASPVCKDLVNNDPQTLTAPTIQETLFHESSSTSPEESTPANNSQSQTSTLTASQSTPVSRHSQSLESLIKSHSVQRRGKGRHS